MQGFLSQRLFPWLFARVQISPDHLKRWRGMVSKGLVIPLLDSPSRIDFLALYYLYRHKGGNYPKFPMGITMLPFISLFGWLAYIRAQFLWYMKRKCVFDPFTQEGDLSRLGRVPFTVYLNPSGSYVQRCLNFRTTPLEEIIRFQRTTSTPIYLVPHLVVYDVLPQTEKKSFYTALWGKLATPKWTLRVRNVLLRKEIQVRPGTPIDLHRFLKQHPEHSDGDLAREIRNTAIGILDKKLRGITGPPLPSRRRIVPQIMEDPDLWSFIEGMAEVENKPVEDLMRKARDYTLEIAADLRISYIKVWEKILRWVWRNLYDGVDVNENAQQRLRRIARNYPIVYVPSHKSHVDYFLLSYVLYKINLPLPLVAAGTNLSFWPVGPVFRRSSAFFIRRTFKDNPLYGEVFYCYLRELIREGIPIEFFIEGGRSRTGKLILPKKGMIAMIIRALFDPSVQDIYVVPTAISYERIVEEEGYIRELRGDEKRKEKKRDLFKLRKIFRKRYGTVFVRFGTPISLKRYLVTNHIETYPSSVEKRRELYQKTADNVIRAIQHVMAVTPSALVAASLLSQVDRSINRSKIIKTAKLYMKILKDLKADIPLRGVSVQKALLRSLELFTQDNIVRQGVVIDPTDPSYFIPPEKRIHLEFSKNIMVAHLAPISLYAWSIQVSKKDRSINSYNMFDFLFHLLRYEFLLPIEHPMHWYKKGQIMLNGLKDEEIQDLCHLTLSTLEGFLVGSLYVLKEITGKETRERKLIQDMIRWGKEMLSAGQIKCSESFTYATLEGWLHIAIEEGILTQGKKNMEHKHRDRRIERGPNFHKAEEILKNLKGILG